MPSIRTITGPSRPAAKHPADHVKVAGFAFGVLLLELLLARGVAAPQLSRFVLLFVGVLAVAFVFRFPLATALVLLGLTDFVFHPSYFAAAVGPLEVRPHEMALAALLLLALLAPRRLTWGGVAGASLAAFLALVAASGGLALWSGEASASDVFNWARPLGLLTFFYVVVRLFPEARDRRLLLLGTGALAAVAGVVALLVSVGAGFGDSLQAAGDNAVKAQEGEAVDRVRLAGLSGAYALFWYAVVQAVAHRGPRRLVWAAILVGISLNIVVSFNRNMWLGIVLGFVLIAIVGGTVVRTRLATAVAVAVAGIALLVLFGSSTTSSRVVEPVVQRGATIFDPGRVTREASFRDRAEETEAAWRTARQNLLLGVGVGAPFGLVVVNQTGPHSFELTPQLFLHNQYLYLLLIAGIPGLLAFVAFLGTPVLHAFRRSPRDPPIAACAVGIALIMISSVVAIYFTVEDMTAVLGLLAGVLIADAEGPAAAGEPSGLTA
ncbi:MAG TPA: O-antigen ligase family protein [Solirubrobacterales bacterium]|nr:O-antigen ligase family protein [Solirubrobacterales bacterium]